MAEEKAQTMQSTETTTTASSVSETVARLKGIPTKEELIKLLETEVVEVTFTKLNGDKRVMPCTLIPSFLPKANKEDPMTQKKVREISDKVIAAWAIESKGYRSFRYDRVNEVRVIPYGNGGSDWEANY